MTLDDIRNSTEHEITLESIRQKKEALRNQLSIHRESINRSFQRIVSPEEQGEDMVLTIVNRISNSLAVIDLIRVGWRLIRKVTSFFFQKR